MIDPIIITGCPRSGTSIIASVIQAGGAFLGEISKRGMYENDRIREEVIKPYLKMVCVDPRVQNPLPVIDTLFTPKNWKESIENILIQQGYTSGIWAYKGSANLIWPVWNKAYPKAKWIIVRRRTGDIIQSCMKTGYMTAYSTEKGWLNWVHEHEKRFIEMMEAGLNCKIIWPERMTQGDFTQIREMLDWLGLHWDKSIIGLVNNQLWNSQKERNK